MSKYLISADIEGITGVINKNFSKESGKRYQCACRYMASDVNAVTQGIINADPEAIVIVRDAHGATATNLDLEQLHPQARLIQGWNAIQNMLTGLDRGFKGAFLVGYHAGGQNVDAVLGHTMHSIIHSARVDGKVVNETGIFALYAGYMNVPIAFISGDDHAIHEAQEQLGDVVGVAVKQSYGRGCAVSLSLEQAKTLLEKGAEEAVYKLQQNKFEIFTIGTPISLEIKFYDSGVRISVLKYLSEILEFDPVYKFDCETRTVVFNSLDVLEMLQRLNLIMFLIYGIQSSN
ncbi:MAG: M55 family metallopeptidase [Coxiellaceae bacterium]|jgi:D-amino peptidase|nr:M55 family metallopeptidase [Coxiellaceae bacterium]